MFQNTFALNKCHELEGKSCRFPEEAERMGQAEIKARDEEKHKEKCNKFRRVE